MKRLLTGMEALARAAAEEGVTLVCGHAVRPVDELLEASLREGVAAESAPNGKVALEVAMGASLAGARAVVAVASLAAVADPVRAMARVGAAGGLAVVAVDDPGLALGLVESDSRTLARALELPWLEPCDAAECQEHLAAALALSERWETPVVVRLTVRVALSARPVTLRATSAREAAGLRRDRDRRVLVPERGRRLRARVAKRLLGLTAPAAESPLNRRELRSPGVGVVTSGAAYPHVREALPDASVLKLGMPFPFPADLARGFAARVERVVVVEELEPVLESELRALGIACQGKDLLPRAGELSPDVLRGALGLAACPGRPREPVPERPPELCAGCPQRALLHALKRLHVGVAGEPGCAALGAAAPLDVLDSAFAAGAAVGTAHGVEAALGARARGRLVALLTEAALLHSGALALAHVARSGSSGTIVVVEDGTLAEARRPVDGLAAVARALVAADPRARVREVDALDLPGAEAALREELARPELSVVIARGRCPGARASPPERWTVSEARCNRCGACLRLGCPAISDGFDAMAIDAATCAGCGLCAQVCRAGAIAKTGPST